MLLTFHFFLLIYFKIFKQDYLIPFHLFPSFKYISFLLDHSILFLYKLSKESLMRDYCTLI